MSLSQASLAFLVQMAFGSMLTFVVNDRAALGPKYFKFSGWILAGLYGLALTFVLPLLGADGASATQSALGWSVVAALVGMLAFSSVSGWDRPRLESALLWLSLAAGAVAVWTSAVHWHAAAGMTLAGDERGLVIAGAFGSALVLGFTTWAMTLGHFYLVDQGLDIRHLRRLVAPLPAMLLGKAALSGAALWLMWDRVLGGSRSLTEVVEYHPERMLDVVNVWARIPVGLLVPFGMALMTMVTVRMKKTQPATGILYAMCTTVYLGDLMGKMLEGATGVPL
ncbi:MAG: hypothetical protein H6825_16935 [Planctomycetes bacterium]|nr:hypothetical protein [Planctomycetota bacterium]